MDLSEVGRLAQAELGIDVTEVQPETLLSEAGIASVDMVMFVYALEEKFGIELAEEDFRQSDTVGELLDLIASKVEAVGS
jgi:acyl carrier protein